MLIKKPEPEGPLFRTVESVFRDTDLTVRKKGCRLNSMQTLELNPATEQFVRELFAAADKVRGESNLELQIFLVSHGSEQQWPECTPKQRSCRGYWLHSDNAENAINVIRQAKAYDFCPRCGLDNKWQITIRTNFEIRVRDECGSSSEK